MVSRVGHRALLKVCELSTELTKQNGKIRHSHDYNLYANVSFYTLVKIGIMEKKRFKPRMQINLTLCIWYAGGGGKHTEIQWMRGFVQRVFCNFTSFCTAHCNMIKQYKPKKKHLLWVNILIFNFDIFYMFRTPPEGSSSGRRMYIQLWYCTLDMLRSTELADLSIEHCYNYKIGTHVNHTIPYLYIQPSSWRWTLGGSKHVEVIKFKN